MTRKEYAQSWIRGAAVGDIPPSCADSAVSVGPFESDDSHVCGNAVARCEHSHLPREGFTAALAGERYGVKGVRVWCAYVQYFKDLLQRSVRGFPAVMPGTPE